MTNAFHRWAIVRQFLDTVNYIARLRQLGAHEKALVESAKLDKSLMVALDDGEITQDQANMVLNFLNIPEPNLLNMLEPRT